jgi:hypothetical protein
MASAIPWPDATDAVNGDVSDITGRRVVHRRKLHIGPEISTSKLLKQLRCTALGDASTAVDDDVFIKSNLVARTGLNGQRDAWVTANVSDLPVLGQVRRDDLVAIQSDPDNRDLRPSVRLERHQVRQRSALEYSASRVGNRHHGMNLPLTPRAHPLRGPGGVSMAMRVCRPQGSAPFTGRGTVGVRCAMVPRGLGDRAMPARRAGPARSAAR